jgi:two-component system, sensor histidine kinase and response regulator
MQPDHETLRVLDEAAALERIGGDRQLLGEIAGLFLQEYPELLGTMRMALASGDAKELERAAHSLKGSASNFGAYACVEAALDLERQARGQDLGSAPDGLGRLESRLADLHPELQRLAGQS